jgi:hypothetical protein
LSYECGCSGRSAFQEISPINRLLLRFFHRTNLSWIFFK